jgi:hypothetical protein
MGRGNTPLTHVAEYRGTAPQPKWDSLLVEHYLKIVISKDRQRDAGYVNCAEVVFD